MKVWANLFISLLTILTGFICVFTFIWLSRRTKIIYKSDSDDFWFDVKKVPIPDIYENEKLIVSDGYISTVIFGVCYDKEGNALINSSRKVRYWQPMPKPPKKR